MLEKAPVRTSSSHFIYDFVPVVCIFHYNVFGIFTKLNHCSYTKQNIKKKQLTLKNSKPHPDPLNSSKEKMTFYYTAERMIIYTNSPYVVISHKYVYLNLLL